MAHCDSEVNDRGHCMQSVNPIKSSEANDAEQTVSCLTRCDASDPLEDRLWVI